MRLFAIAMELRPIKGIGLSLLILIAVGLVINHSTTSTIPAHAAPLRPTPAMSATYPLDAFTHVSSIGGIVGTVTISGTRAYIGEGSLFIVLDVSNPAAPQRLGSFTTDEFVQAIVIVV